MRSVEHGKVPPQLLAQAQRSAAPHLTDAALADRFGPRSSWEPAAGQVWRAARYDTTALVLLVAVDAEMVTAAPITIDFTDISTGAAADVVMMEGSASGVSLSVWAALRRPLGVAMLDRPVDDVGAGVVTEVLQVPPGDLPAGGTALTDEWADVRAELLDDLAELAGPAVPETGSAVEPTQASRVKAPEIDLATVDPAALEEAVDRLGEPLPVLLDLIDGKRPPTPGQAEVLRAVLGAAPAAADPPMGLVIELSQPRWRGLVCVHRRRDGVSEDAARNDLAYQVMAMAARQTGDAQPAWSDRIRRWAQAHRLDPDA